MSFPVLLEGNLAGSETAVVCVAGGLRVRLKGLQVETQSGKVELTERVVALDDVEPVLSIQHRKCKRTPNLFGRVT